MPRDAATHNSLLILEGGRRSDADKDIATVQDTAPTQAALAPEG